MRQGVLHELSRFQLARPLEFCECSIKLIAIAEWPLNVTRPFYSFLLLALRAHELLGQAARLRQNSYQNF